jgi:hypothetical protein
MTESEMMVDTAVAPEIIRGNVPILKVAWRGEPAGLPGPDIGNHLRQAAEANWRTKAELASPASRGDGRDDFSRAISPPWVCQSLHKIKLDVFQPLRV